MIYRTLGKTGYSISAVTYGGIVSMEDGQKNSDNYVSWALSQGINYFDVAPTYGDAEEKLGNSLIPYRDQIYLACKTNIRTRKEAEEEMEKSRKLLHTDYFDVYQMHGLCTMEELETVFAPGGVMELLIEMKEKGIAKKLGFTAHSETVALEAIKRYDFDTVLFPFNWHMNLKYGMGNRLLAAAKEKNMGILCMKSMIERAWDEKRDTDAKKKYPKSWCKPFDVEADHELLRSAVKYALSLGVDTIIPPGNIDHFRFGVENIEEMLSNPYGAEDEKRLKEYLKKVEDYPFFDPDLA